MSKKLDNQQAIKIVHKLWETHGKRIEQEAIETMIYGLPLDYLPSDALASDSAAERSQESISGKETPKKRQ